MLVSSPLKEFRLGAKLTLEQLGERFGVNKSTVMRWEEGQIPAERVLTISEETGIAPSNLRPDIYPPSETERAQ